MKLIKDNLYTYITITLGIVIFGVVLVTIINSMRSSSGDTRTRASAVRSLKVQAIVSLIDSQQQKLAVEGLKLSPDQAAPPGTWEIIVENSQFPSSLQTGMNVQILVNSAKFSISTKKIYAFEVTAW